MAKDNVMNEERGTRNEEVRSGSLDSKQLPRSSFLVLIATLLKASYTRRPDVHGRSLK
jgi:hypothetical protein